MLWEFIVYAAFASNLIEHLAKPLIYQLIRLPDFVEDQNKQIFRRIKSGGKRCFWSLDCCWLSINHSKCQLITLVFWLKSFNFGRSAIFIKSTVFRETTFFPPQQIFEFTLEFRVHVSRRHRGFPSAAQSKRTYIVIFSINFFLALLNSFFYRWMIDFMKIGKNAAMFATRSRFQLQSQFYFVSHSVVNAHQAAIRCVVLIVHNLSYFIQRTTIQAIPRANVCICVSHRVI